MSELLKMHLPISEMALVNGCVEKLCNDRAVNFTWKTVPREAALQKDEPLYVSGWIVDEVNKRSFASVYVCIDDNMYLAEKFERPDIAKNFGEQCLMSGYLLQMNRPEIPLGKHTLRVAGLDLDGKWYFARDSVNLNIIPVEGGELERCISRQSFLRSAPHLNYFGNPKQTYIIAATPRSGSTLLCDLIYKTGIAGWPFEYLNPYEKSFIEISRCNDFSVDKYIEIMIRHTTTANGVYGEKVMYNHYRKLNYPLDKYDPKYIYISRNNLIKQGISRYKSVKTMAPSSLATPILELSENDFSYNEISQCILRSIFEDEAWRRFFKQRGIEPVCVVYEDFIEDMAGTVSRVLKEALDIDFPPEKVAAPTLKKQADELSEYFYNRMIDLGSGFIKLNEHDDEKHG